MLPWCPHRTHSSTVRGRCRRAWLICSAHTGAAAAGSVLVDHVTHARGTRAAGEDAPGQVGVHGELHWANEYWAVSTGTAKRRVSTVCGRRSNTYLQFCQTFLTESSFAAVQEWCEVVDDLRRSRLLQVRSWLVLFSCHRLLMLNVQVARLLLRPERRQLPPVLMRDGRQSMTPGPALRSWAESRSQSRLSAHRTVLALATCQAAAADCDARQRGSHGAQRVRGRRGRRCGPGHADGTPAAAGDRDIVREASPCRSACVRSPRADPCPCPLTPNGVASVGTGQSQSAARRRCRRGRCR